MTDDIYETPSSTPNFQTELAEQLAELVPEAVADGKIDVLKLQELLAQDATETSERFGLFWPGKQRALRIAQMPTTATLRPEPEKSKDWDTTKNVFIEGDNLEVLKILQKHYHGKIKMIYIDPPYNTGKDFVYPDNYKEGLENYLEWTRQVNNEGKKVSTNSETEGRYHSNWLTMMYPRLKLARNLLTQDGVIFVSIDDNEASHLKKLLDEIFGEANFVATICHKSRGSVSNDKIISPNHNFIHLYAKNYSTIFDQRSGIGLDPNLGGFDASDENGPYKLVPVDGPGGAKKGNPYYEFLGVEGYYRYSQTTMQELFEKGEIVKRGNTLQRKYYLSKAQESRKTDTTWWDDAGFTSSASAALKKIMGGTFFDSPKPVSLIQRMLKQFTEKDSIILDFFAGSGTTGHAVMLQNLEDNGTRRFIQVQLPEPIANDSDAGRAGFITIADISRKRIMLASEMIEQQSTGMLGDEAQRIDLGFRSYSLADTGFAKWRVASDVDRSAFEQHLFDLRDNADDLAEADDLLTEVLLKQGYSLSEDVERVLFGSTEFRSIGNGLVLAYMNEHLKPTLDDIRLAMESNPLKFVMLEDSFQGDDELKTNLKQLCKSKNIELWTA